MKKVIILFISVGLLVGLVSRANALEPPAANQLLWLKADAGVTTNGSGVVTNWLDQSGNNNHAVLSYGDPRPAVTNFGLPRDTDVVRFDGTDGFRLTDDVALHVTDVSIYTVCQLHPIPGTETMIASYTSGFGWLQAQQGAAPGGAVYFFTAPSADWGTQAGYRWARVTTTISTSTGEKKIRVNGVQEHSSTGKSVLIHALSQATVGYYAAGVGFYIGDIAEILVYDSVDTNQQTEVEDYLYWKYWVWDGIVQSPGTLIRIW